MMAMVSVLSKLLSEWPAAPFTAKEMGKMTGNRIS